MAGQPQARDVPICAVVGTGSTGTRWSRYGASPIGTSGIVRHPASADACDEFGVSARSVHVHATAEPGPRWPECRDQPPFPPYLRELTPEYRRSTSHVTRPRPQLHHLTR